MALVLRKAVLTRNVSFLKCIKGRQITSTAHKNNPAPLSKAVLCRSLKEDMRPLCVGYTKIANAKRLSRVWRRHEPRFPLRLQLCVSCPTFVPETMPKIRVSVRHFSPPRVRPVPKYLSASPFSFTPLLRTSNVNALSTRSYSKPCSCGCPCPCPCGPCGCASGCSCLPPPCNTSPPRCVQYMTGYYYYPYGTWFCGPYHVTGTCCPVGPNGPCEPCGPCPKCAAPSCICPTAACPGCPSAMCTPAICPIPAIGNRGALPELPRTGVMPGNTIKCPLSQEATRQTTKSGISRFFPFNSTAGSPQSDTKRTLPTTTVLSSFVCPYSTQARPRDGPEFYCDTIPNVDRPKSTRNTTGHNQSPKPMSGHTSFTDTSIQTKFPDYETINKRKHHTRCRKACPILEKPRLIMSLEQRDKPKVKAGAFDYASIPNYRNPYQHADIEFKAYES